MAEDSPLLTSFCFFSESVLYELIFGGKPEVFLSTVAVLCVLCSTSGELHSFFLRPKYSSFTSLTGLVRWSVCFFGQPCVVYGKLRVLKWYAKE